MATDESRTDRLPLDRSSRETAAHTIAIMLGAYVAPVAVEAYTTIATPDPVRAVASALLFLLLVPGIRGVLGNWRPVQTAAGVWTVVRVGAVAGLAVLVWLVVWIFPLVATQTGTSLTGVAEETGAGELSLLPLVVFVPLWVLYQLLRASERWLLSGAEGDS